MVPSDPFTVTWVVLVADTVRVEELPATIVIGLAVMATVGFGFDETVTVAVADALPPGPVAFAVYVVVAVGLTDSVPPPTGSVKLELSLPVMVT